MKVNITKNNILMTIYYILFSIRYFTNFSFLISTALWCSFGCFIFMYCFINIAYLRKLMCIFLFVDFLSTLALLFNKNYPIYTALSLIALQGVGILIYEMQDTLEWTNKMSHMLIVFLTIVSTQQRIEHLNEIGFSFTKLVSMNGITIILLFMLCIDMIYCQRNNLKINLLWYVLSLWAIIMCAGNGGILSITLLFIGLWIRKKNNNCLSVLKLFFLVIAGGTGLWITKNVDSVMNFLTDDNARFVIWEMYYKLAKQSWKNILLGAPIAGSSVLMKYRNMHNTYINFHFFYGLIPFLYYCGIVVYSFVKLMKKGNYLLLLICGLTMVRALTDATEYCFLPLWIYLMLESIYPLEKRMHYSRFDNY